MLERLNPLLRVVSLILAAVVLYQLARAIIPRSRARTDFPIRTLSSTNTESISTNKPGNNLPPEVAAVIDKIKDSQILGMIMHPPPMALIGIGGKDAILRGPNGQMGLLREGEELAGVKLLKIGTNRVLVEHEGQTKELTLFQGFGSETLLPKTNHPPGTPAKNQ